MSKRIPCHKKSVHFTNSGRGKIERTEKDGFTEVGYDLFGTEDEEFTGFLEAFLIQKQSTHSGGDSA